MFLLVTYKTHVFGIFRKKYENSSTLCQKLLELFQNHDFQTFQFFTSHEENFSNLLSEYRQSMAKYF